MSKKKYLKKYLLHAGDNLEMMGRVQKLLKRALAHENLLKI